MAQITVDEFNAELDDPTNGIAPEAAALIKPVALEADSIYGSLKGSTLTSVAIHFPFAKETQAFVKGNATKLATLAPDS